ncbi:MAG: cell division protein FtsZ [bacterium]
MTKDKKNNKTTKSNLNPPTVIKVIGVGGSGSNAISRMMQCHLKGVELIVINTDSQDLEKSRAHRKLRIGRELTRGLGSGMDPEIGRQAAEEQKTEIIEMTKGADMIFIAYGLGGGTGTGAGPVVAELAKQSGALTMAVVTMPFSFEGQARRAVAEEGLKKLEKSVDALVAIENDRLMEVLDMKTTVDNAFWYCDEILRETVSGISNLIILPGPIDINFADIKSIMTNAGLALFGVGRGSGERRAEKAAQNAITSPLLNLSIKGAKRVLFNVIGGKDISLAEIDEVAKVITKEISKDAKIIFGAVEDEKIKKGEIRVTVIAADF